MMADIFDVAMYFRWRVDYEAGDNITHLKLQKLCYYAQAWHCTFTGERLFEEQFEHWPHGPACYDLYREYKDNGWQPIPPDEDMVNFNPAEVFEVQELDTLSNVWETYGDLGAKRLELLTHQEEPWLNTEQGQIITVEAMKEFYTRMMDEDIDVTEA